MDDTTHRRFNPLTGRWVLVSPDRVHRPGNNGPPVPAPPPAAAFDPTCELCPGNHRAGGAATPRYRGTYVFGNDSPALPLPRSDHGDTGAPGRDPAAADPPAFADPAQAGSGWVPAVAPRPGGARAGLLRRVPVHGTCRVISYGPEHDRGLVDMTRPEARAVVDTWAAQDAELAERWRWVQVFENRGASMGASSSHPHGQVWACDALPAEPAAEDTHQREHFARAGSSLLLDYARTETAARERVVLAEEDWLVVVPYWASWPYETLLLPRRPVQRLARLDDVQRDSLAHVLGRLLAGYDSLFAHPFPYSMGWHGAPGPHPIPLTSTRGNRAPEEVWQLHAHFYSPLLRSPAVRRNVVGYEMFAEAQRELTPENAAARLRTVMTASWDGAETLPPCAATVPLPMNI
ncbi:UDP-glucose--hexose-1-phosphate uridylyltransferase [Frankia sp. AgB32]|uniref:UDP-glucose--hexose-1-phosphate uridylyltransferase n=1 Tax=Frankia sp. AgB32 TaxID=631119 RepID=UPI00200EC7CF|nr:UDP-glucose--hexose-1-phosphate uridylyltransferase [Frankia sp. AgB32]MCK9895530.1 UDP-glucose--hexose-1-phosphate uridylyltransferase [Frankia sp. AgB32]